MGRHIHDTTMMIGETEVLLRVMFHYVRGYRATGPSYSSGGEPGCGPEIDVLTLEWSLNNSTTKTFKWNPIVGPMFDLIAEEDWLYDTLCQAAADGEAEARVCAAEDRYDQMRDEEALR